MLAYLDALIAAVSALDSAEIHRLLAHPLRCILTRDARCEAETTAAGRPRGVPLRLLQLRHQTAYLLGEHAGAAASPGLPPGRAATKPSLRRHQNRVRQQTELPLAV